MKIVKATHDDEKQIKELWLKSFEEDDERFFDSYWVTTLRKGTTILLKEKESDNDFKCMLTYINKEIVFDGVKYPTILIEGIATPASERRKGHMAKLLNHVIKEFKDKLDVIVIQAYKPEIYTSFGFNISHYLKWGDISLSGSNKQDKTDDTELLHEIWEAYSKDKNGYHARTLSDMDDFYKQVVATGGKFIANHGAYICMWENQIFEIAYKDTEHMKKLINELYGTYKIRLAEDETIFDNELSNIVIQQNTMLLLTNERIKLTPKMYFPEYV